jgi:hypothetical protein
MPPNSVFVEYQTDIIVENRIWSAAKKFSFFLVACFVIKIANGHGNGLRQGYGCCAFMGSEWTVCLHPLL